MNVEEYKRDSEKEEVLKDAIQMAIFYCEEKIPITDSWSAQGLKEHLENLKQFQKEIEYTKYALCKNQNYEGFY